MWLAVGGDVLVTAGLAFALAALPQSQPPPEPAQPPGRQVEAPPPYEETVIVTATRLPERLGESVTLASVVDRRSLDRSPSLTLDDTLRQVPGFSLFRRSSSLVAHPTSQGVSLRGIGPSGTSRSLVLVDGIPINDPFGGWVQWNRLPPRALQAVEVVRGAASPLYGSSSLSGTIQLVTRRPEPRTLEVDAQLGTHDTRDVGVYGSDRRGLWAYSVSGRLFDTGGFLVVPDDQRGAVDTPARSAHQNFVGRVERGAFHLGVNVFHEERGNGTALQTNATRLVMLDLGARGARWTWQAYALDERFESTFSRIAPDRSSETLTAVQDIPARAVGGGLTFNPVGRALVGADVRHVTADGRRQTLAGAFVQDVRTVHTRVDLLGGLRIDLWQNDGSQAAITPRVGALVRASDLVTLRASAYRGFRAPTLNELYRPFRVGNVSTLANSALDAESLGGVEGGADLALTRRMWIRLNGFWNELDSAIANVTLSATPQLIVRQRQNLGGARVRGGEAEVMVRAGSATAPVDLRAAYLYSDAVQEPSGLRLPQVARHQVTFGVRYEGPLRVDLAARVGSRQFDDDLNTLPLEHYGIVDLVVGRAVTRQLEAFVSIENLFDQQYAVGRTPVEMLGTPRLVHGGLRVRLAR